MNWIWTFYNAYIFGGGQVSLRDNMPRAEDNPQNN